MQFEFWKDKTNAESFINCCLSRGEFFGALCVWRKNLCPFQNSLFECSISSECRCWPGRRLTEISLACVHFFYVTMIIYNSSWTTVRTQTKISFMDGDGVGLKCTDDLYYLQKWYLTNFVCDFGIFQVFWVNIWKLRKMNENYAHFTHNILMTVRNIAKISKVIS